MRNSYADFTARNAEIIAVGPDNMDAFQKYWDKENLSFIGLPDPDHKVARMYKQEVNLFKLGRMPLNTVIDRRGNMRYVHFGLSMSDIPDNEVLLQVIDALNAASE